MFVKGDEEVFKDAVEGDGGIFGFSWSWLPFFEGFEGVPAALFELKNCFALNIEVRVYCSGKGFCVF